jgi:hypothetical protein
MYIRARAKALTSSNIIAGWKSSGLVPLEPMRVLEQLPGFLNSAATLPSTPLSQSQLDLSLLERSPPDGTKLHKANVPLNSTLRDTVGIPSPVRRYTERLTQAYEIANGELITARKQISDQNLLNTRKQRTKGKRISFKGKFVFSTEEDFRLHERPKLKHLHDPEKINHRSAQLI